MIGRYSIAAKISNFDPSALREVFENIPENIFETSDSYDLTNRLGLAGFPVDETVVRREIRLNVPEIWASENVQILLFLTEKSSEKPQVELKIREAIRSLSFDQTFTNFQQFLRSQISQGFGEITLEVSEYLFSPQFAAQCVLLEIFLHLRQYQKVSFENTKAGFSNLCDIRV